MKFKMMVILSVLSLSFVAGQARAENAQQERMKSCNAEAAHKGLNGPERQTFMKKCLSGTTTSGNSQQEKMKTCNAHATDKGLKGDARKAFMKSCLSGQ